LTQHKELAGYVGCQSEARPMNNYGTSFDRILSWLLQKPKKYLNVSRIVQQSQCMKELPNRKGRPKSSA